VREDAVLLEDDMCFAMAAVLCAGLPPQDIDILETVLANIRVSDLRDHSRAIPKSQFQKLPINGNWTFEIQTPSLFLITSDMDLPAVGTRISVAGSLGTVKFAGSVDNTKGVWLGVEWDDPDRGKHSGTKDGKHYFECRCV
jgi:hypothetical protein